MLRNNIIYIIVMVAFMLPSCIKSYEPVIESKDAVKFVVSGQVVQGDPVQHINISKTSAIDRPQFFPVTGCVVTITDDKGISYNATDKLKGDYEVYIPESALVDGAKFKVDIFTPDGQSLTSDFDEIHDCPDLDSVYYQVEKIPTNNPDRFIQGVQFYLDFDASTTSSKKFRWESVETWEYHSTYPIEWYYDGVVHHVTPPDYSRFICWKTEIVKNVYTLSTENLAQNKYSFLPLHFVDNYSSQRLVYGYSLLVRQYALSEAAYIYWDKMRINSTDQGGLYDKQPLAIKGNMRNTTFPDQDVLGFFGAAAVKSKRIFVTNALVNEHFPSCAPIGLRKGLKEILPPDYPGYLYGDANGFSMAVLIPECVDCLVAGGINVKPDFWPY